MLDGVPAPDGAKPLEGEAPKPEGETKPLEPVEYKDFALPEGIHVQPDRMNAFKEEAAKSGLSQDVAQKFVDMYAENFKQLSEAPMRAWTELQNKWQAEVKADPEIGGANLDKNLATIKSGLSNLLGEGASKFYEALNLTGAGNNPEIIRGLLKAAAPHAPASPVEGRPGGSSKSAGSIMYPTMAGLGNGHET
ncbi:Phage-associated protease [Collimonas arenae]|uniref:Phage-associated protease n=2 Tax=Collimonas arenae TaxID=279058 RepID=A0A0A1FBH0_9BURK|nr:Phage-associated protease [Collimonas arenae]